MITLTNLTYSYHRGVVAINDASAVVSPGIHLLLGENGAGKTTLLRIIGGLLIPQNGSCSIDGEDVKLRLPSTLQRTFFLPDTVELPAKSVNAFAAIHSRFYPNFSRDTLEANLREFGLTGDEEFSKLSLGMRHKAIVAYAISLHVDVLLLDNLNKYELILASGSPRRRELLGMLDLDFKIDTSYSIDESVPAGVAAIDVAPYLSGMKAMAFPLTENDRKLVITADTVVIIDDEVLGKPVDESEACLMLEKLQGRTQTVVTGVTVRTYDRSVTFRAESKVEFAELSRGEIEYYVKKYRPLDKAGAYGIQEWIGAAGIRSIEGSFYNVMGLPVHRLYECLKTF